MCSRNNSALRVLTVQMWSRCGAEPCARSGWNPRTGLRQSSERAAQPRHGLGGRIGGLLGGRGGQHKVLRFTLAETRGGETGGVVWGVSWAGRRSIQFGQNSHCAPLLPKVE